MNYAIRGILLAPCDDHGWHVRVLAEDDEGEIHDGDVYAGDSLLVALAWVEQAARGHLGGTDLVSAPCRPEDRPS